MRTLYIVISLYSPVIFGTVTLVGAEVASEYPCRLCGQVYGSKASLRVHRKIAHNKKNTFACDKCCCRFKTPLGLRQHRTKKQHRSEAIADTKQYVCTCGKVFGHQGSLDDHQTRRHNQGNQFACKTCGYRLKSAGQLLKHERSLHGPPIVPLPCPHCPKNFTLQQGLSDHMDRCHNPENPHWCLYCSYVFKTEQGLKQHISTTHNKKDSAPATSEESEVATSEESDEEYTSSANKALGILGKHVQEQRQQSARKRRQIDRRHASEPVKDVQHPETAAKDSVERLLADAQRSAPLIDQLMQAVDAMDGTLADVLLNEEPDEE